MRYVYAHFPINVNVIEYNPTLFNELSIVMAKLSRFAISWERSLCVVALHEGVKVTISTNVKDELVLEGESLDNVSQSAASIQQICNVRNKEYVSSLVLS